MLVLMLPMAGALLTASLAHRPTVLAAAATPRAGRRVLLAPASPISPIDIQIIQRQFASVRELPRVTSSFKNATGAPQSSGWMLEVEWCAQVRSTAEGVAR